MRLSGRSERHEAQRLTLEILRLKEVDLMRQGARQSGTPILNVPTNSFPHQSLHTMESASTSEASLWRNIKTDLGPDSIDKSHL